ncbi:Pentachlorophenol 4-monooxygenase [Leucoagaricus sp. SymC.cos]|nr:Pentachlorophenol 4-monooxygenase [Leucoagaricus sp. SymC.cos]
MLNRHTKARVESRASDAAHVHSPTGAQGLNCSIQDATNITWKLALVLKDLASPSILSTYNDERLPIIAQMLQATSQLYTHLVVTPKERPIEGPSEGDDRKSGWFRWRNSALELYGVNYRFSDIVLEERNPAHASTDKEEAIARAYAGYEALGSLLAGDRAPEAPCLITAEGKETCLFKNYFRLNRHTVLVFASDTRGVSSVLGQQDKWPESVVQILVITEKKLDEGGMNSGRAIFLVDSKGHAADAYRVEKGALNIIVVRPDGFVGAVGKDAEGANRYFRKIFCGI